MPFITMAAVNEQMACSVIVRLSLQTGEWGELQAQKKTEDVILANIQSDLRMELPPLAITSTENICFPRTGPNSDCDPATTVHVDGFLYDDEAIDELCKAGKLSRNYCTKCRSRDVQPLTFITHSASANQIRYIFCHLLPDITNRRVLDVGSRTGALLYGAYLYSRAGCITGVEIDPTFCQLQNTVIEKYKMAKRVQVIQDDIQNQAAVVSASDIVILNNVFDFFVPKEIQIRIWKFLFSVLKKDTLLVTVPSLCEALGHLQTGIDLDRHVKVVDTESELMRGRQALLDADDDDEDLTTIHIYRVLAT